MNDIKVFFKRLNDNAIIPVYASFEAAGCDLFAAESATLLPGNIKVVGLGFAMSFNRGMEAQIRPRSGLASKKGLTVINSPGTIDSDYRGEVKVALVNHSSEEVIVQTGDRIAQMIFAPVYRANFLEVTELSDTLRGSGGFGHSGI